MIPTSRIATRKQQDAVRYIEHLCGVRFKGNTKKEVYDFVGNWHIVELFPGGPPKGHRAIFPDTVCKSTGKTDKYGVQIYENDIGPEKSLFRSRHRY